jgi:hypothetical protein
MTTQARHLLDALGRPRPDLILKTGLKRLRIEFTLFNNRSLINLTVYPYILQAD